MAAKSKKRLSKIENKLLKLDKLELKDVFCSICQSILIEPVTLPCYHDFCQRCFSGSIENNALCCPLCRLRIGSWLRTATKQKNIVNVELWNFIKAKFSQEIVLKTKGEDIELPEEVPLKRLSAPGEIRSEYEAELTRLKAERLRLEQKQLQESELLIKSICQEEEEAHKKYLEGLKHDEIIAQSMQQDQPKTSTSQSTSKKAATIKPRLKATRIDAFLCKKQVSKCKNSPLLEEITTSADGPTSNAGDLAKTSNHTSPEMVPSYGKLLKSLIDKKIKNAPGLWNKENGENVKDKKEGLGVRKCPDTAEDKISKTKNTQSLLVSLPLPCFGILQHKTNIVENKNLETDSVDSMRQELCYFKPIEGTTPTSFNTNKGLPLRVPGLRVEKEPTTIQNETSPSRSQYLQGLCHLRNLSLAKNLPSAFVIALNSLRVEKIEPVKCCANTRSKVKKAAPSPRGVPSIPQRKNTSMKKQNHLVDGVTKLNTETNLRRTRSMGSIAKDENETTPKKAKLNDRKACSERKPYLRSDSKKSTKNEANSPLNSETLNNNKVTLAVKKLSSPLKNCDVKKIVQEQLRIEKIIEQEKSDYELACKMEAEWNGRRLPRRAAGKRALPAPPAPPAPHAPRPAKKLKV